MSTIKDPAERTPPSDLSSAATHPFSQLKTTDQFAAIRERMAEVAAELRQMALRSIQPNDDLLKLASKLEAMASKEKEA
jgi:hypothetical protein